MKYSIRVLIHIATSVLLSSCGLLFGGTRYRASIVAVEHPKAQIFVDQSLLGKGTAMGSFSRHRKLNVELREEGCEPYQQTFGKSFRAGNFVLTTFTWGLFGMAVDLATGAAFQPNIYQPEVTKLSQKNFSFAVEYPGCPVRDNGMGLVDP
jgi:hypothetical protein